MSMEMRALGRSDLKIAPLMLGGNVFGWTADEPSSFAVLDTFVDGGFNAIDTADSYAFGDRSSEAIIGAWLKGRGGRHKLMIATKCGEPIGDKKGLSRAYILAECDQSLRRLGTDYIDLYQAHFDDPDTPQEETAEAYARLIEQGKVRVIGASNFTAERLKSALDVSAQKHLPRYESLQPRYNLADRDMFEGPLQELCLKEQIGVICYFGLASGFLTGKYRSEADLDKSPRGKLVVKPYLNERGYRILEALDQVSAELDSTPAQVSLAWLMVQPTIVAPIVSATSAGQMNELVNAARLKLDDNHIQRLNRASAPEPVAA
jgi:aryl-alcohol dehydrogenase-like predicted oxidoreductase